MPGGFRPAPPELRLRCGRRTDEARDQRRRAAAVASAPPAAAPTQTAGCSPDPSRGRETSRRRRLTLVAPLVPVLLALRRPAAVARRVVAVVVDAVQRMSSARPWAHVGEE